MIRIYHNPECSKSNAACEIIGFNRPDVERINYLINPPSETEMKEILKMLGMKASELLRRKEPLFIEKFEGKEFSEDQWLTILCENPILIERPIVVKDNKAIIARPPEMVRELLG